MYFLEYLQLELLTFVALTLTHHLPLTLYLSY